MFWLPKFVLFYSCTIFTYNVCMNSDHISSHQEIKEAEEYLQIFLNLIALKQQDVALAGAGEWRDDNLFITPIMRDMLKNSISKVLVELQQLRDMVLENKFKNKNSSNIYSVSL